MSFTTSILKLAATFKKASLSFSLSLKAAYIAEKIKTLGKVVIRFGKVKTGEVREMVVKSIFQNKAHPENFIVTELLADGSIATKSFKITNFLGYAK